MRLTNGVFHRPIDKVIVNEVKATYSDVPVKGAVVLDLGANIGASAKLMLDKGALRVIAVEPDPSNVILAKRNLGKRAALVIWAAVGPTRGRTTIHVQPRKPYLSSLIEDKGRMPVSVTMVTLGGLLEQFHPSVIKCDIEFGEYDLPELHALPDFVRVLAMEIHVRYDLVFKHKSQTEDELRAQRQKAADMIASIEAQGFRQIKRKDKRAKEGPITDDTGLAPLLKSIDAIWTR